MTRPRLHPFLPSTLALLLLASAAEAQIDFHINGFCKQNSTTVNLDPSLVQPSVTIYDCVSVGVPFMKGLASVQLMTAGTLCEGLDATLSGSAVTTPEDLAQWGISQIGGLSSPFPVAPCPPTVIVDYGKHNGSQDVYSFSIGSLFSNGPLIVKHIESEMVWNDTLTIDAPGPMTIALPVGVSASIFAAESFGTSATEGRAKLTVTGSVGAAAVNEMIEVVSVSVIPTQDSINVSRLLQVPLNAGPNTVSVQLSAKAEVTATAQGAGFVAGSATAGVSFPNSVTFGRFVNGDGSALPADLLIVSNRTGAIFEDTTRNQRAVKMGFSSPGSNGAPLLALNGSLAGGGTLALDVSNALPGAPGLLGAGYSAAYFPLLGGVLVPDITAPGFVKAFTADGQGDATVSFVVPTGLPPGFQAYFQGWVFDPGAPNGLAAATGAIQGTTPR